MTRCKKPWHIIMLIALQGCAINFELTSQRTALENQILGSHKDIDDNLYLISSVRALEKEARGEVSLGQKAKMAVQNQIFNRDDIDEFKGLQILGEAQNGSLKLLPKGVGLREKATKKQVDLAAILVAEENHDRMVIWRDTIRKSPHLESKDLFKVRKAYSQQIFAKALVGHWFYNKKKGWHQKREGSTSEGE